MNTNVNQFFIEGCGRCPLGNTPDCKVVTWQRELELLRGVIQHPETQEESKWGFPCYTYNQKNVYMLGALNDCITLSFFKGVLIDNDHGLLQKPGPNSQAARVIRLTTTDQIVKNERAIRGIIHQAVLVEKSGQKVEFNAVPETIPMELKQTFSEDPALENAFYALTPGRQRGYIIQISQAKQSKTRYNRIEKYKPMIMSGIGLHDKYKRR